MMSRISQAAQSQAGAAGEITQAATHMTQLTQQVAEATQAQARSSAQIIDATEVMNRMTQHVTRATDEQQRGAGQVVKAIDHVSAEVRSSTVATERIAGASSALRAQAEELVQAIAFFKDNQDGANQLVVQVSEAPAALQVVR
jgi:methyl-accepting chemotaxis protein